MAKSQRPTIALIYDFDGTLSPGNMQEYDFLKQIGIKDKAKFWRENDELLEIHNASNILCYMKLMLDKAKANRVSIKREKFVDYGASIPLYDGVEEWFEKINKIGSDNDVDIIHYINSSGIEEIIEGTPIAKHFEEIYACRFMYEDGVAVWPAVAVDFTAKTQFLFMINKGIAKIKDNAQVNRFLKEEDRPVPFRHMIYFGDGETDIPCMRLIKQQGGNAIAVYKTRNVKKRKCAEQLVSENRVNFACAADYKEGSEIYNIVTAIIKNIKAQCDFRALEKNNQESIKSKKTVVCVR